MKTCSLVIGSVLAALAMPAGAQTPASDDEAWQQHWQKMQYRQAWQSAKTPQERQKLREEHWQSMQSGMAGCPMGGPGGGMGKQGGKPMQGAMGGADMMGAPSREMLDMRIQHMEQMLEQMLEQMRSHRQMLDKQ